MGHFGSTILWRPMGAQQPNTGTVSAFESMPTENGPGMWRAHAHAGRGGGANSRCPSMADISPDGRSSVTIEIIGQLGQQAVLGLWLAARNEGQMIITGCSSVGAAFFMPCKSSFAGFFISLNIIFHASLVRWISLDIPGSVHHKKYTKKALTFH